MSIIKSVFNSDSEAIFSALKLHSPNKVIDVDPTYGLGAFYNNTDLPQPTMRFDIYPQKYGVMKADARNLPIADCSVNTIVFDPPFLATTGRSLRVNDNSNLIAKRFSVFQSERELHQFYIDSLKEFYRILRNKGIVIFKCQDKVSSGRQYFSHVFIINEASKIGFYTKDLGVLIAKSRIVAGWQKNQKHFRKFHSYFIVFSKELKSIRYT